jgi:hypothetical protein
MKNEIINSLNAQKNYIEEFFEKDGLNNILEAGKFISIQHKSNNSEFYDEYVLNDYDFPLPDNKYYQAITEMSARISNIVSSIKSYKDLILDIDEINIDIEILNEKINEIRKKDCDTNMNKLKIKKIEIQIDKKNNELMQKQFGIGFIKSDIQEVYNEFIAWKTLVEKYEKEIKLPNYGVSRQAAMEIKKAAIRHTVDPKNAQGGEIPIMFNWKEFNKKIIDDNKDNKFILPFVEKDDGKLKIIKHDGG